MAERKLAIRFFDVSAGDALLYEALDPTQAAEIKLRALERLGIVPRDDETPLQAWLRVMCEENGLPYTQPVPQELADAILDSDAARFVWFLAGGRRDDLHR